MKKIVLTGYVLSIFAQCMSNAQCMDSMQRQGVFVKATIKIVMTTFPSLTSCLKSLNIRESSIQEESKKNLTRMIVTSKEKEDEFTKDDAYFALNGVKMQLKQMIADRNQDGLLGAIETLINIKEQNYFQIVGYRYCTAILCIHFQEHLEQRIKDIIFGSAQADVQYGKQLMSEAAKPKTEKGDDDYDAASYLEYNQ